MQTLRIFISSPGDVADERQIAGKVLERLQGKYWSFVRLDDVFWEQKVIRSTAHYQDELVNPGECEMVVGILWSRLGSLMPEKFCKASGERYQSGTEWELEMAFDAYEQSLAGIGDRAAAKPDIIVYRRNQPRPSFEDPAQEALAAEQITKLEAYLSDNFWFPDGTIKRPVTNYQNLDEFEEKLSSNLEELILRQIPGLKPGFEPPPISGSPFKGLQAFDFADSDRYFGRNREIREIQQRLVASAGKGLPFVLIYGGSGYGKSSLMRAGLAPVLTRPGGSLDEIQGWRRVPFQPAKGTGSLCERLARALIQAPTREEAEHSRHHRHWPLTGLAELVDSRADTPGWDSARLTRHFSDDDQRVFAVAAVVETLESLNRHLLLEIDQLEEMFTTPGIDANQRAAFLRTVGDLCLSGRIWVVATMRSEFFPRVAEQPELFALVGKERGYILPPPDRQSLREIIRYPVLAARLDFERRMAEIEIAGETAKFEYLDDQILSDAESSPDALPLLEFTLQQLYEEKRATLLTWEAYAAAGGLKGAIAKRAREVYDGLDPVAREARHRIFAALVHVDAARNTVTRQRASLEALNRGPGAEDFLQAFLGNHLLITDEDALTGKAIVTLAHEALISHWDELAIWINDHRGDLLARQRLHEQTQLWIENGMRKSYLLAEARLAEAERVKNRGLFNLTGDEHQLIIFSQKRASKKLRILQVSVLLFAIIAIAAGFFAWRANTETLRAEKQTKLAESETKNAISSENKAKAGLKEASIKSQGRARQAFDGGDPRTGMAYLAEALEYDPGNHIARLNASNRLIHLGCLIPLPLGGPLRHLGDVTSATFSPDGTRVVTASEDKTARIWDAATAKPIGDPLRHGDTVVSATFSLDGSRIVTASEDNTARIWDAATGKPLGEPLRHLDYVSSASFSSDGTCVVTASADKTVCIWDASTGKQLCEPFKHGGRVRCATFSPDATRVVTASEDNTARIWDAATGKPLGEPLRHSDVVASARFSPDGTRVVTASADKNARVWDAALGTPITGPLSHEGGVSSANFSPDGTRIVTASWDAVRIWDIASGKLLGEPLSHEGGVFSANFSPDGSRVATASFDKTVRIWDSATGIPIGEPLTHDDYVNSATFSPDGAFIVTASRDNAAHLWAASTGKPLGAPLRHLNSVNSAMFSPGGTFIVTASADKTARIWDAATAKPVSEPLRHLDDVNSAFFSSDGTRVVTASADKTARIWDAATGKQLCEPIKHDDSVYMATFSPDGARIVTASTDKTARVWDAASGVPITEPLSHEGGVFSANFSPDGLRVVTAAFDKTARIWYGTSGPHFCVYLRHLDDVNSASFSSDGTRVVTASADKTARIWDAATGKQLCEPIKHDDSVYMATFSPDGARIVTASADETARVWCATSGAPITEPLSHEGGVFSAIFSPDGSRVATASFDKTTRIWDATSGTPIAEPLSHEGGVFSVTFSPDGSRLITTTADKAARIWDLGFDDSDARNLAQLLVLSSKKKISIEGRTEDLSIDRLLGMRSQLIHEAEYNDDRTARLIRWLTSFSSSRPLSPDGSITLEEHVFREIDWCFENPGSDQKSTIIREANALLPSHPLIPFGLASIEEDLTRKSFLIDFGLRRLPDDPEIQRRAASLLGDQGELAAALGCLERALLKSPEDQPTLERHLDILWELGRKNEAIGMAKAALEKDPEITTLLTQAALFLSETGQEEKTRDLIQKALAIEPASALVWRRAGWCFAYLEDWSGAKDAFTRAKSFANPITASILGGLSISQWQSGDQEGALKTFQELVSIEPNVIEKEYIQALPWSRKQRDVLELICLEITKQRPDLIRSTQ